ncbi:hypothetical protein LCGC14_1998690 [marine sediment metagenome]|uniref:Uncharacterized protein n=1 Tax=marine sediment metagenome TaxID=412755 RepID=A0A0F9F3P5_9ZZZZ
MANISLGEMLSMASFLRQKRRSKKQSQSQSQQPKQAKSVPVKGWGGPRSRKSVNLGARKKRLALISSGGRGGSTRGASKQITGQQKIEYMKKGLAAQEESAQRIRSAALEDMLDYQRTREGDVRSWPISEGQTMMNDLMALMVEQGRGQAGKSNLPTFVEPMGQSGLQKMDLLKS